MAHYLTAYKKKIEPPLLWEAWESSLKGSGWEDAPVLGSVINKVRLGMTKETPISLVIKLILGH